MNIPAGSVRFENNHDVSHVIGFSIVDIGSDIDRSSDTPGVTGDIGSRPGLSEFSDSVTMLPDESRLFTDVFTYNFYYVVEFELDGEEVDIGPVLFNPAPDIESRWFLGGQVQNDGSFTSEPFNTENPGPFPPSHHTVTPTDDPA